MNGHVKVARNTFVSSLVFYYAFAYTEMSKEHSAIHILEYLVMFIFPRDVFTSDEDMFDYRQDISTELKLSWKPLTVI